MWPSRSQEGEAVVAPGPVVVPGRRVGAAPHLLGRLHRCHPRVVGPVDPPAAARRSAHGGHPHRRVRAVGLVVGGRHDDGDGAVDWPVAVEQRSEEHTSELQSLMRISYDVFLLYKNTTTISSKTAKPKTEH